MKQMQLTAASSEDKGERANQIESVKHVPVKKSKVLKQLGMSIEERTQMKDMQNQIERIVSS